MSYDDSLHCTCVCSVWHKWVTEPVCTVFLLPSHFVNYIDANCNISLSVYIKCISLIEFRTGTPMSATEPSVQLDVESFESGTIC